MTKENEVINYVLIMILFVSYTGFFTLIFYFSEIHAVVFYIVNMLIAVYFYLGIKKVIQTKPKRRKE